MPLWYYVTLHPDAKLSPEDLMLLSSWSRAAAVDEPKLLRDQGANP